MDLDESEIKKIRVLFNDPIHKDEIQGNHETITQEILLSDWLITSHVT